MAIDSDNYPLARDGDAAIEAFGPRCGGVVYETCWDAPLKNPDLLPCVVGGHAVCDYDLKKSCGVVLCQYGAQAGRYVACLVTHRHDHTHPRRRALSLRTGYRFQYGPPKMARNGLQLSYTAFRPALPATLACAGAELQRVLCEAGVAWRCTHRFRMPGQAGSVRYHGRRRTQNDLMDLVSLDRVESTVQTHKSVRRIPHAWGSLALD